MWWVRTISGDSLKKKKCPPHDPVHFILRPSGRAVVCVRCKKVLLKPKNFQLTQKEVNAVVEFATILRKKNQYDS